VVTDNLGLASAAAQVTVTVSPAANQAPVANAGANLTLTLPTSSTPLAGSGTDADGTISTYTWSQVSGPSTATFSSKTVATPTVSALVAGSYVFSLVVTDNLGLASAPAQVTVTVNAALNQAPVANAGPNRTLTLPTNTTTLAGSGTDADGTVSTYTWNQMSGPSTATFSSKTVAVPTVSSLVAGSYVFSLIVTDNLGLASAAAQVTVTVSPAANQAPVANAGPNRTLSLPTNSAILAGSGTDADGTISTYTWSQVSGPNTATFSSKTVAVPTVSALVAGNYVFSLVVTDNLSLASAPAQVTVTVSPAANQAPVANAGLNRSLTLPTNTTTLLGSGTDADGTISTYTWSQVSGPSTATFSSKTVATPTISQLVAGSYVFSLVVTDNLGLASAPAQVTVTVNAAPNQAPVASAGPNRSLTLPTNTTTLVGSGTDADGTVSAYAWSQVSGPNTATFSSKTVAVPTISSLVAGSYVFSLVVTDNLGLASAAAQVTVTVSPAANQAPVASAGPNRTLTLPTNTTTLAGSGTDADGTISSYTWSQVSGPNTATFSSKTVAVPTLSALVAGSYVFSLIVTDNLGLASAAAQVTVTVSPAANQ
ncbi:PKD domain-containing protein, partial [Hymenobacter ginkgonis]